MSYNSIGVLLRETGRPAEAIGALEAGLAIRRKLAEEHPEAPDFASDVGGALNNLAMLDLDAKRFSAARDRLKEAVQWQRKALAANPASPIYRQFLTNHLSNQIKAAGGLGDVAELAEAQRELEESRASDPELKALDSRLSEVAAGRATPTDEAERLRLAQRAYDTGLYLLAARLWGDALEANPKLGDDRQPQYRYNAACAAALAAGGAGKAEPAPGDAEKARLRKRALDWLKQELETWNKLLAMATPDQRGAISKTLNHWRNVDADLASVRDASALAKLPEAERAEWAALWAKVDAALARARGK